MWILIVAESNQSNEIGFESDHQTINLINDIPRSPEDDVGLTLDEPILDDFEIIEVSIGPIDFSTDERKSFISIHEEDS